ncbi:serine hydrolase [uncultured Dokdonia sp.]|uniref:serine hydrolase n=1 Tax=uncultured Dokdonia sp. TaxID=575653 RepID=UPI002603E83C|nr:serine hydrolase [uncultured Dokdonia sp.]
MKLKKITIISIALALCVWGVFSMSIQNWFYSNPAYVGKAFQKQITFKNSSFTQEKLDEITSYLEDESETSSMLVLENGKVIYEYGDVSQVSYIASCRKSVLAMLYGKYVANGTIDLEQTIGDIGIDEDDGLLTIEKQATIENIISSRSGVFHIPANGGYDEKNIKERGTVQPGEYFVYNNWDFNVAGYILEQKSGKSIYEEIEEQLAIPLGFEDWNIENQKRTINEDKSRYSAYHIHISTRDMAKIGQLMLQKGQWEGKQLISKEWVEKITSTITPVETVNQRDQIDISSPVQFSYGNMWWLVERFYDNPDFEGSYTASGYAGQFITVIPKRNVVIAHKTNMDLLTYAGLSQRSSTPSWRYWVILRKLLLNKKNLKELAKEKSVNEMIAFVKETKNEQSIYDISEGALRVYGKTLMDQGNYEEAIQFFELSIARHPSGYYTHYTLDYYGKCLLKLNRNQEAIKVFENSLKFNPDNEEIVAILSDLK